MRCCTQGDRDKRANRERQGLSHARSAVAGGGVASWRRDSEGAFQRNAPSSCLIFILPSSLVACSTRVGGQPPLHAVTRVGQGAPISAVVLQEGSRIYHVCCEAWRGWRGIFVRELVGSLAADSRIPCLQQAPTEAHARAEEESPRWAA